MHTGESERFIGHVAYMLSTNILQKPLGHNTILLVSVSDIKINILVNIFSSGPEINKQDTRAGVAEHL